MPPILSKQAKIALFAAAIVTTSPLYNQRKRRKEWAKFYLRNRQRYSHMNLIKDLDDKDFRIYLRICSEAFIELLDLVKSHITKSDTVMRQAVSAEERLVATLKFLASEGARFRCDYMYTDLGWFKYHEVPLTFHDAYLQCKYEGAMLASPTTAGFKSVMMELMCNADILTGIHSTFAKGQYYTVDGIPLERIHHEWAPLEPDNKNNAENCIASDYRGRLSDVNCDEPRPFICHKKHSNIVPNDCGTTDPDYHYERRTNKCYKFHNKPKRFAPAFFTCSAEGGHLAIINSEEELKVIHEIHALYPPARIAGLHDKNSVFLGFYYEEDLADWTTIHGETLGEAGFAKFQDGQPSNSTTGEYCGAVYRDSFFNDVPCDRFFAFICEKSPHYPQICESEDLEHQTNYTRTCKRNFEK